jgi:lipoprotein NlpD
MKKLSIISGLLGALLLAACTSTPMTPAPVVERSINKPSPVVAARPAVTAPVVAAAAQPKAAIVMDGKSYTVKKGDTLFGIALENGLSYRDLAEWNGITNPSYIQVDQVLRLTAPSTASAATATAVSTPVTPNAAQTVAVPTPGTPAAAAPAVVAPVLVTPAAPIAPAAVGPAASPATGEVVWQWPVKGKASQPFVEGKSKGLEIAGKLGDTVAAAADGEVVYAGSALKGYGQMLIIKHSAVYLTAYAHNSKLLAKEGQQVKRGQKVAEMGNTESEDGQTKLHFELRRSGKPVDPVKLLPVQ